MPLVRSALGAVNAGISQAEGVQGARGAEGARGASGQATPPYSDDYKKMGHEWLAIAKEIEQADRATINQLTEQYRLPDNPLSTELGKILLHTGLIPQSTSPLGLSKRTADEVWDYKEVIVQRLRSKGNESIKVAQEIEKLKAGDAADTESSRQAILRALDTGDGRDLKGHEIAKLHRVRAAMGQIPPQQALESRIFNPLGDAAYALDLLALRGAIKDAGKIISAARRVDVLDSLTSGLIDDAASIISRSSKGELRKLAALSRASVDELGIFSKHYTNLPGSVKNFPGVRRLDDDFFVIDDQAAYIRRVEKLYENSGNTLNSVTRARILEHVGNGTRQFPTQHGIPGLHAEVQSVNSVINQVPEGFDLSKINVSTIKLAPGSGQGLPFPVCSNCRGILSNSVNILTGIK